MSYNLEFTKWRKSSCWWELVMIPHEMEIQAPDGSLDSCETKGCF